MIMDYKFILNKENLYRGNNYFLLWFELVNGR
jgi:hypothetical protein